MIAILMAGLLSSCGADNQLDGNIPPVAAMIRVVEGTTFDFGPVQAESSKDHRLTLQNVGTDTATELTGNFYLSLNFSFAGGTFPGEGGTCTDELRQGESCTIVIRFTPKYVGDIQGLVQISYWDGTGKKVLAQPSLKGKGMGEPTP